MLVALLFGFVHSTRSVPQNRHLFPGSAWPVAHFNSYGQGSVDHDAITVADLQNHEVTLDTLFDPNIAGVLSIYWYNGSLAWGSSGRSIFKVNTGGTKMRVVDAIKKPVDGEEIFNGIYSLVSNEGVFYTAVGDSILAVKDLNPDSPEASPIFPLGLMRLKSRVFEDEKIISLNMLYSGQIGFLTTGGRVGIISKDLRDLLAIQSIAPLDVPSFVPLASLNVTNAMTVDESGGLYVVSSQFLHRLHWDDANKILTAAWPEIVIDQISRQYYKPDKKQIPYPHSPGNHHYHRGSSGTTFRNKLAWTTRYNVDNITLLRGRLSKIGSGSSPSLFRLDNRLFVTITDGMYMQNILVFDALNGTILSSKPVTFDDPNLDESYSEQSILVDPRNGDLVVVQNALTSTGKKLNGMMHGWDTVEVMQHLQAPSKLKSNVYLMPVVLGDSSRGVQKFNFDPLENKLTSVWANHDYGCPNSIPTMSTQSSKSQQVIVSYLSTDLMYCVSKGAMKSTTTGIRPKPSIKDPYRYPQGFEGTWTIAGIDWISGKKIFDYRTGSDLRYNSLYSAVQIGPNAEIVYGSLGKKKIIIPPQNKIKGDLSDSAKNITLILAKPSRSVTVFPRFPKQIN